MPAPANAFNTDAETLFLAMRIVLATRNPGKVAEFRSLLSDLPVELMAAGQIEGAPHVEESASTLEGNASGKAEALYAFSGLPTLADDTGLEVDALGGLPGVRSARFAGPHADDAANRRKLLAELAGVRNRSARFRTVIAFADDMGVRFFEGICRGMVLSAERGRGGFGYDALFVPEGQQVTFAESSMEAKNRVSHRALALRWSGSVPPAAPRLMGAIPLQRVLAYCRYARSICRVHISDPVPWWP